MSLGTIARAFVPAASGALRGQAESEQEAYRRKQDALALKRQLAQDAIAEAFRQQQLQNQQLQTERAAKGQAFEQGLATEQLGAQRDAQAMSVKERLLGRKDRIAEQERAHADRMAEIALQNQGRAEARPVAAAKPVAPRPLPASVRTAVARNNQTIANIDEAIAAIQRNPEPMHRLDAFAPEIVRKFTEDSADVATRAPVADVGSLQIHDRTGANMNIREEPRLAPFVPDVRDKPGNALVKLQRLRQRLQEYNDGIQNDSRAVLPDDDPAVNSDYPAPDEAPPASGSFQARPKGASRETITAAEAAQLRQRGFSDAAIRAKYDVTP